jgi:hypothetical protein
MTDVGVTGPIVTQTPTKVVGHPGEAVARVSEAACPIEEMQKVGKATEIERPFPRPGMGTPASPARC